MDLYPGDPGLGGAAEQLLLFNFGINSDKFSKVNSGFVLHKIRFVFEWIDCY